MASAVACAAVACAVASTPTASALTAAEAANIEKYAKIEKYNSKQSPEAHGNYLALAHQSEAIDKAQVGVGAGVGERSREDKLKDLAALSPEAPKELEQFAWEVPQLGAADVTKIRLQALTAKNTAETRKKEVKDSVGKLVVSAKKFTAEQSRDRRRDARKTLVAKLRAASVKVGEIYSDEQGEIVAMEDVLRAEGLSEAELRGPDQGIKFDEVGLRRLDSRRKVAIDGLQDDHLLTTCVVPVELAQIRKQDEAVVQQLRGLAADGKLGLQKICAIVQERKAKLEEGQKTYNALELRHVDALKCYFEQVARTEELRKEYLAGLQRLNTMRCVTGVLQFRKEQLQEQLQEQRRESEKTSEAVVPAEQAISELCDTAESCCTEVTTCVQNAEKSVVDLRTVDAQEADLNNQLRTQILARVLAETKQELSKEHRQLKVTQEEQRIRSERLEEARGHPAEFKNVQELRKAFAKGKDREKALQSRIGELDAVVAQVDGLRQKTEQFETEVEEMCKGGLRRLGHEDPEKWAAECFRTYTIFEEEQEEYLPEGAAGSSFTSTTTGGADNLSLVLHGSADKLLQGVEKLTADEILKRVQTMTQATQELVAAYHKKQEEETKFKQAVARASEAEVQNPSSPTGSPGPHVSKGGA